MNGSANPHPALALKLRRGAKRAAGREIIDTTTGKLVGLVPDGELAAIVEALFLASPDLLWACIRAIAHIQVDQSLEVTPATRKLRSLLDEAQRAATDGRIR